MKVNADKARGLDAAEITKQLREASEQMFRLRFQLSMGQADGLTKLRNLRKERARMLTVQRERELGQAVTPAAKPLPSNVPSLSLTLSTGVKLAGLMVNVVLAVAAV